MSHPQIAEKNMITDLGLERFVSQYRQNADGKLFSSSLKTSLEARNRSIAAVVLSTFMVIGSGLFGAFGFMFPSALGTIGQTAHLWGVWAAGGSGVLIGTVLLSIGSVKVHRNRKDVQYIKRQEKLYEISLKNSDIQENLNFIRDTQLETIKWTGQQTSKQQFGYQSEPAGENCKVNYCGRSGKKWQSAEVTPFQARILIALCKQRDLDVAAQATSSF